MGEGSKEGKPVVWIQEQFTFDHEGEVVMVKQLVVL